MRCAFCDFETQQGECRSLLIGRSCHYDIDASSEVQTVRRRKVAETRGSPRLRLALGFLAVARWKARTSFLHASLSLCTSFAASASSSRLCKRKTHFD